MEAKSESRAVYFDRAKIEPDASHGNEIIAEALSIIEGRLRQPGELLTNPQSVKDFLRIKMAGLEHEIFLILFLDAQNRLIASEELFRGTLTQASVYPREVVKRALTHNAAAVILSHNHPSGLAEPSRADEILTSTLKQALALIDVKVLDHLIVGGLTVTSFAETGKI